MKAKGKTAEERAASTALGVLAALAELRAAITRATGKALGEGALNRVEHVAQVGSRPAV